MKPLSPTLILEKSPTLIAASHKPLSHLNGAHRKTRSTPKKIKKNGASQSLDPHAELRELLQTIKKVRQGNFSVRCQLGDDRVIREISEELNNIIALNENMASEFQRVAKIVGQEGKMTERASIGHA